jgi:hypothetical protein
LPILTQGLLNEECLERAGKNREGEKKEFLKARSWGKGAIAGWNGQAEQENDQKS